MVKIIKTQSGFSLFFLFILIAAVCALYFLKDKNGKPYYQKFMDKKQEVLDGVDKYKDTIKQKDEEIMKNL